MIDTIWFHYQPQTISVAQDSGVPWSVIYAVGKLHADKIILPHDQRFNMHLICCLYTIACLLEVSNRAFTIQALCQKSCTLPLSRLHLDVAVSCLHLCVPHMFSHGQCFLETSILCICYILPWFSSFEGNQILQMLYPHRTLHMTPSCLGGAYSLKTLWVVIAQIHCGLLGIYCTSWTALLSTIKEDNLFQKALP